MYHELKLITVLFIAPLLLTGQSREETQFEPLFQGIEKLIDKHLSDNQDYFDAENLVEKKKESSGTNRINYCFDLFVHYIYKSTEQAKQYNEEAYQLSVSRDYHEGYLHASLNNAYILFVQGEFDQALDLILKVEADSSISQFSEIEVNCATLKSYIFTERGEYDVALETAVNLLERGENFDEPYTLMRAYSAASHVYLRLGEYEKALENCLKGLEYVLQLEKIRYIFPKIDEIARMTHKLKGSEKALKIYEFYLRIEKKISSPGGYIQSVVYMNIADIYTEQSKFEKAKDFLARALVIIDSNNYRFRKPRAHVLMAKLYFKMDDIPKTIDQYQKAYEAAQKINAYDVIKNVSKSLSNLYAANGDEVSAASFATLFTSVSDSLFTIESNQRIKILEGRRKISEVLKEKEILEIRTNTQKERYQLIQIVLALALISGGVAFYSYFKVKKKNELLYLRTKELTIEKINKKKLVLHNPPHEVKYSNAESDSENSYMDEELKTIILTKLERFEGEHFFLDTKCSLSALSEKLQTNQKYLSQVINNEKKANFNNYINELRINHLLDRLIEDLEFRNSKLSYIARASGFNNPNTFYSAFKKRLGILPSYFIKQLNEEDSGEITLS